MPRDNLKDSVRSAGIEDKPIGFASADSDPAQDCRTTLLRIKKIIEGPLAETELSSVVFIAEGKDPAPSVLFIGAGYVDQLLIAALLKLEEENKQWRTSSHR